VLVEEPQWLALIWLSWHAWELKHSLAFSILFPSFFQPKKKEKIKGKAKKKQNHK